MEIKYGFPIAILGDPVDVFKQRICRAYLQHTQGIEPLFQPLYHRRMLARLHAINDAPRRENLERVSREAKLRRRRLKFGL